MDFLSNFLGSIFGGGGSISGGGGGGADSYKGDGPLGIGAFLEGVAKAYRKERERTGETIIRLRDADKIKLDSALDHALNHFVTSQFEKSNAIADARAARDNAFHTYADEYLPTLYGKMCHMGIYNSSASQLLANDAYARTVVKASELELTNIKDYAGIHLREGDLVQSIFGRLIEAYTQSNRDRRFETRPDIGEFSEDAAAYMVFLGVMQLFSKRAYFADNSSSSNKGLWDWLPEIGSILYKS